MPLYSSFLIFNLTIALPGVNVSEAQKNEKIKAKYEDYVIYAHVCVFLVFFCIYNRKTWVYPWVGKIIKGRHSSLLQYSYLENPHGQSCLAGYSPWGHKKSETTEQLDSHNVLVYICFLVCTCLCSICI